MSVLGNVHDELEDMIKNFNDVFIISDIRVVRVFDLDISKLRSMAKYEKQYLDIHIESLPFNGADARIGDIVYFVNKPQDVLYSLIEINRKDSIVKFVFSPKCMNNAQNNKTYSGIDSIPNITIETIIPENISSFYKKLKKIKQDIYGEYIQEGV